MLEVLELNPKRKAILPVSFSSYGKVYRPSMAEKWVQDEQVRRSENPTD
jgi:hypothetical protein